MSSRSRHGKQKTPQGGRQAEEAVKLRGTSEVRGYPPRPEGGEGWWIRHGAETHLAQAKYVCVKLYEPPYTERYVRWCERAGARRPPYSNYG